MLFDHEYIRVVGRWCGRAAFIGSGFFNFREQLDGSALETDVDGQDLHYKEDTHLTGHQQLKEATKEIDREKP